MAECSNQISLRWLWPALCAALLILATSALSFIVLWHYAPINSIATLQAQLTDRYLWHVIRFTFWQAGCSTFWSILLALPVALAFYRHDFSGRQLLLKLYAVALILPVLVAVFGLITLYGQQGWLAQLCRHVGYHYNVNIYGLPGILLVHIFFNLPFATHLFLASLQQITPEQRQIAAQLGMRASSRFRFIEWPVLYRQLFVSAALIFMLCFASFAAVLALGGGPNATTLELAIYQTLRYDFDLAQAALLALLQFTFCVIGMQISLKLQTPLPIMHSYQRTWYPQQEARYVNYIDYLVISLASLFILLPLCAVIATGLNSQMGQVLQQARLWQALQTSMIIAMSAGLLASTLTLMLLWGSRQLSLLRYQRLANTLELSGMTILAMPSVVLATGFFLLLIQTIGLPSSPYGLIIFINGLMALPFCLKLLHQPMYESAQRYNKLCLSLGIKGVWRFYYIDLMALRVPITHAFAFSCILSIGDFGIIALFGNQSFTTLPLYLYEQLAAYHSQAGAVTALFLLMICFILFHLITGLSHHHDRY